VDDHLLDALLLVAFIGLLIALVIYERRAAVRPSRSPRTVIIVIAAVVAAGLVTAGATLILATS
jgi:hypothetical protein